MKREEPFVIPPGFWATLTRAEMYEITRTGELNAEQCARLWHMTDRQGRPPISVELLIATADLDRLIQRLKATP